MSGNRLTDPRWHRMLQFATAVYGQLQPGDEVISSGFGVLSTGQVVMYSTNAASGTLHCSVVTDVRGLCGLAPLQDRFTADVTLPGGTP